MQAQKNSIYAKISIIALLSRSFIILMSYIPTRFFEHHDKSSFMVSCPSIFRHLLSWDAIHFLHIANKGYTHEHSIPFFPLLPLIIRILPFSDNFTKAVVFNSLATVLSALLLYKIGIRKYSHTIAYRASIFFLFNPASVVYSSFYSESLFALLFLMAYYYIVTNRMFKASIIFSLCSLTRSNTIVFLLFVRSIHFATVLLPMVLFQLYTLLLVMRQKVSFKILIPYSYIQEVYWGQGFLKFIRPWHIPDMLYGLPAILYGIYVVTKYVESRLYLRRIALIENSTSPCTIENTKKGCAQHPLQKAIEFVKNPFFTDSTTPVTKLVIILAFQIFILVFFIHWNIAFRFISFNPILYWSYAAISIRYFREHRFRAVTASMFTYGVLYAVLFGLFYSPA